MCVEWFGRDFLALLVAVTVNGTSPEWVIVAIGEVCDGEGVCMAVKGPPSSTDVKGVSGALFVPVKRPFEKGSFTGRDGVVSFCGTQRYKKKSCQYTKTHSRLQHGMMGVWMQLPVPVIDPRGWISSNFPLVTQYYIMTGRRRFTLLGQRARLEGNYFEPCHWD